MAMMIMWITDHVPLASQYPLDKRRTNLQDSLPQRPPTATTYSSALSPRSRRCCLHHLVESATQGHPVRQTRVERDVVLAIHGEQHKLRVQHQGQEFLRVLLCAHAAAIAMAASEFPKLPRRRFGRREDVERVVELADAGELVGVRQECAEVGRSVRERASEANEHLKQTRRERMAGRHPGC